jgi:hypothetical protein
MRNGILSLLGAAVTLGAVVVGCGGDDTKNSVVSPSIYSEQNESCSRTNDCRPGLLCISNRCTLSPDGGVTTTPGTGGTTGVTTTPTPGTGGTTTVVTGVLDSGADVGAGGTTQTTSTTTTTVRLSGENQSCTRTSDCESTLLCISLTCMKAAPVVDAGADVTTTPITPGPRLGARGESCQVASDCSTGLICVPNETGSAVGSICELANYGLTPTGSQCGGECKTAADCCEMPQDIDSTSTTPLRSCADVLDTLGGSAAAATACTGTSPSGDAHACFLYVTYCNCAANTWACTGNQCVYKPTGTQCTAAALPDTWGGCPSKTRLGNQTWNTTCSDTGTCTVATTPVCNTTSDCTGLGVIDSTTLGDKCTANECICYQKSGCYRKCTKDIDCPGAYKCSTSGATANLCVPSGGCSTNLDCAKTLGNAKAECRSNVCVSPCASDYECNPSGANRNLGHLTQVCSPTTNTCQPLGCTSDLECWQEVDGSAPKSFCVTPTAGVAGTIVQSAIVTGTTAK